jgi:hypothetical protein
MPNYIDGPEVKLSAHDRIFVDAVFYSGEKLEGLQPRRLFPISGLTKYVALIDDESNVVCIIMNIT